MNPVESDIETYLVKEETYLVKEQVVWDLPAWYDAIKRSRWTGKGVVKTGLK